MVGLNDCINYSDTSANILSRYQTFINDIDSSKKSSAIVIIATMTPARQRFYDLYGSVNGSIDYQLWLDVNNGIMGNGANAIQNVSYRIDEHTIALNDGNGSLASFYNVSDNVHENNLGRQLVANAFRKTLNQAGYLTNVPSEIIDNYFGNINNTIYLKGGWLNYLQIQSNSSAGTEPSGDIIQLRVGNWNTGGNSGISISRPANYRTSGLYFQTGTTNDWFIGTPYNGGAASTSLTIGSSAAISAEKMIITNSGDVGINTISPNETLSINGMMQLNETLSPPSCTATSNGSIARNATGLIYCNLVGNWVYLYTG